LWAWHLAPGWYDAAVRNDNLHYVEHLSFGATAWLFWWNVIDPAPLHARMGYLLRIVYLIAAGTAESVLAAFITLAVEPFYAVYVHAQPIVSISPMDDQELGGLIMWVPGQLLNLAAVGIVFAVWFAQSERQQAQAEVVEAAARDAREAAGGTRPVG
jgi:putative membrane protein